MRALFRLLFLLLLLIGGGAPLAAQSLATQGVETERAATRRATVYAFAISQSLNDSVVYVSEVVELPNVELNEAGLLVHQHEYSAAFAAYLRSIGAVPTQTAALVFEKKLAKAMKLWTRTRERLDGKRLGGLRLLVRDVRASDFQLRRVER